MSTLPEPRGAGPTSLGRQPFRLRDVLTGLLGRPARNGHGRKGHELGDGVVDLRIVHATVMDLDVAADTAGGYRASFVLRGRLDAVQLGDDGVTTARLPALTVRNLAVSLDVMRHLGLWEDRRTIVQGMIHFDRRRVGRRRGRGTIRRLCLLDEENAEISLAERPHLDGIA